MSKRFIGTSGYHYPHWQGIFYPDDLAQNKWLEYYSQHFNSVELNVTFYRLPPKKTFQNWFQRTPKDFSFVAKGSRFITHIKKLKDIKEPLELFFNNVFILKDKLAAVLWQLPPGFKKNISRLEYFLKLLKKIGGDNRNAFEFRNKSWFDIQVYELFKKYNICLCIADSGRWPLVKEITSDFIYLRFHGRDSLYASNYSDKELRQWANFVKQFKDNAIFAFFNNDAQGFAIKNAIEFRALLAK